MSRDPAILATLVKGLLALCLLCNALGWSLHVQAAGLGGGADHSIMQIDSDTADPTASLADAPTGELTNHCNHGELHFFGIIPSLNTTIASARDVLDRDSGPRYAGPHPQPLIIPPIA